MPRRPKKLIRRPAGTDSFAASTEAFAGSPELDMDAFSEILGGVVLKGAMFFNAEFSAPWCFNAPAAQDLAPTLAPGASHLLIYHFLIEGSGLVRVENESPIRLEPGDVIVLPHGHAHEMRSAEGAGHQLSETMMAKVQRRDLSTMR